MKITIDIPTEELIALQKSFIDTNSENVKKGWENFGNLWLDLFNKAIINTTSDKPKQ